MKRYRVLTTILAAAAVAGACVNLDDIESRVSNLENKVAELDRLCGQLNSNIGTLDGIASVMAGAEVITDIAEIKENGEVVGYAITFSKSGVKKIYNGKNGLNGTNGTNGADGTTPEFKIEQGCWWVRYGSGEWKNLGQATGEPGAPGSPGNPGQTPEFKIEEGCWWIRFGEGEWENVGQATGDAGEPGAPGDPGLPGETPEFKIEEGCWWIRIGDGEWTNMGQATGDTGNPGGPGTPGTPGLTPSLKIEDGCWWVRYGDGDWENLGQATGDKGDPGDPGEPAPVIGIVPGEGGAYYWTLGGEIMLDNAGQPFAAGGQNGITPELKIEDGYWWVRYGSGSWVQYGQATGSPGEPGNPGTPGKNGTVWQLGTNGNWWADNGDGFEDTGISYKGEKGDAGDSMFTSVTSDGNSLTVVLAGGGGTFVLPVTADLAITFAASTTITATPGSTISISYTITSSTGSADIDVLPTSGLKAKVTENGLKGTITVVVGSNVDFEYDKVSVIVTNGSKTLLKKITFNERGTIVVTDEHTTSLMSCKGGFVNFNIAANVEYEVSITSGGSTASWVQYVGTKALAPYTLEFQVDSNSGPRRTATITVFSSETTDTAEFTIIQYAATGSFVVTATGSDAKVPEIIGKNLSGLVDFEGELVEWSPAVAHTWTDAAAHSAEYFVEGATGLSLGSLTNLVNLDVSDF